MNIDHQQIDISALAATMRQLLGDSACSRPVMDLAEHAEALVDHANQLLGVIRFMQDFPESVWDFVQVTGWAADAMRDVVADVPDTVPLRWVSDHGSADHGATDQDGDQ